MTYKNEKISYTYSPLADEPFIMCKELLFENGINEQNIIITEYRGNKIFYVTDEKALLPFDIFAASFYLVSRYEEYLPHIRDEHDRFEAKNSLAFANNFLETPLVNKWAHLLKHVLLLKYSQLKFVQKPYEFLSTIDIDNAYAYREKGLIRTVGGFAKSIAQLNIEEAIERCRVLLRVIPDPYDSYEYQLNTLKRYQYKSIYFILLGDYDVNDKNIPVENKKFQSLIKFLSDYVDVGIHPSYGSNKSFDQLKKEVNRLSRILNRDITKSRQHFLKLVMPVTYRNLIELDITDDYSMGYASQLGFRASICSSFNFYDLDNEIETKLRVHPFAVMDATLKYYLKVEPALALEKIKPIINEVKGVSGTFISIWHNDSLCDKKQWKGWREVYEKMVQLATS